MPGDYRRDPKTGGLDWSTLKPACRTCGTRTSDLNRDDQCTTCAPRESLASVAPKPRRRPTRRSSKVPGTRRRVVVGNESPHVYDGGWVTVRGVRRPTPKDAAQYSRPIGPSAAQYPRPIGPSRRPGNGPERTPLPGAAIAEAYLAGATLRELADQHAVSAPTIARALDDQGVVRRKQPVDYTPDFIESVRRLYVDEQLDQATVAARLDITTKVVQTAMARGGIAPRESASARSARGIGHPIKITDDVAGQIITRYRAGEAGPQLAKEFGVAAASIYHLLEKHNVPRHGRRTPGLGRDGSIGLKARIADLGVSPRDVNQWALTVGLLDMPKPGLPSARTVDAYEAAHRHQEAS